MQVAHISLAIWIAVPKPHHCATLFDLETIPVDTGRNAK